MAKKPSFPTEHGEYLTESNGNRLLCWEIEPGIGLFVIINCLEDYPRDVDDSTDLRVLIESIKSRAEGSFVVTNRQKTRELMLHKLGFSKSKFNRFFKLLMLMSKATGLLEDVDVLLTMESDDDEGFFDPTQN